MQTSNVANLCVFTGVLLVAIAAAGQAPETDQQPSEEPSAGASGNTSADLSKQLANPLASLISVPIQINYNEYKGPDEDRSSTEIIVQPVIPFTLNQDWNLISRTIIPIVDQDDFRIRPRASTGDGTRGMGDILQSLFFSPSLVPESGWVWGVGPVFLLPTATDDALGGDKWAAGPTAVALRQQGPWTCGALWNHLWSFAGKSKAADVNASYLEPWVSYVTKTNTTLSLSTETTYDWENDQWTVPIVGTATQLVTIGNQVVSLGGAVRYWAESPDYGPEGWGVQALVTFLFPR